VRRAWIAALASVNGAAPIEALIGAVATVL
jgi:hypothetical protein